MENDKKSTFSQNLTRHKFSPSPANLTKNYDSAADGWKTIWIHRYKTATQLKKNRSLLLNQCKLNRTHFQQLQAVRGIWPARVPAAAARLRPFFLRMKLDPMKALDATANISPLVLSDITIFSSSASPHTYAFSSDLTPAQFLRCRLNPSRRQSSRQNTPTMPITGDLQTQSRSSNHRSQGQGWEKQEAGRSKPSSTPEQWWRAAQREAESSSPCRKFPITAWPTWTAGWSAATHTTFTVICRLLKPGIPLVLFFSELTNLPRSPGGGDDRSNVHVTDLGASAAGDCCNFVHKRNSGYSVINYNGSKCTK